ncbi:MAG: lactate utilization protein [Acidihalobacter sp.]|uniref:LutC/YkgG family protein n=1 Tax=Acidihalobacter sp. TaxID=1872108 RepID=UPI00307F8466
MSEAKQAILARLRANLSDPETRRGAVEQRLDAHARGPAPAVDADAAADFIARLEAAAATVVRVHDGDAVVAEASAYLEQRELPPRLLLADDPWLQGVAWPQALQIDVGAAAPDSLVCLSAAYAGIAETGSLVLLSGPVTPTGLNFLPDHYLCLLRTVDIVPRIDDLWGRLRAEGRAMPRALNLITGPSRTADVEQTIQLGAHGPRSLHVLLLDEA